MQNDLQDLRGQLDALDRQLIELLRQRFVVTGQVGQYKSDYNLPAQDKNREKIQMEKIRKLAMDAGINADFAAKLLRVIIDQVIRDHNAIKKNK